MTPESEPSVSPPGASRPDEALYAALVKADRSESLVPLVAGLAREINEHLTRVLAAVSLAKAADGDPSLAKAEEACLAARETADRMLGLAKGGGDLQMVVSPREILTEAAKIAGAGSSAEISFHVREGVDPVRVDRGQVVQAFQNLVRNALDALSPPPQRPRIQLAAGNVALAEGRIAGLPAGDYVEFEVRDNGCGISAENLPKIWDPFFTTKKHGSGLGLSAAVAIVRRHGGEIGVDSDPAVGTVITVFLPGAARAPEVRAHAAPSQRFRSGRILVMDDDEMIRSVTGKMLEQFDYKFDTVRDGEEAIAHYRRYLDIGRPYDAVILDLAIAGGMGGEETFAKLLAMDPDVRGIASGTGERNALAERCLALGFCGCLPRPYRPSELGKVLGTVLSSS